MKPLARSKCPILTRILVAAVVVAGCRCAFAEDVEKPREQTLPLQIEEGDFVYFRVVTAKYDTDGASSYHLKVFEFTAGKDHSVREIAIVPTADIKSDGTVTNTDKAECLIQLVPSKDYCFVLYQTTRWSGSGEMLGRVDIKAMEVLKTLREKIDTDPDNFPKWTLKFKGNKGEDVKYDSEITLAFAGVRRVYELKSIDIPPNNTLRTSDASKQKMPAPKLRIYIDQNGQPLPSSGLTAKSVAWTSDFPSGNSNIWEVREGVDCNYLIRLCDANTTFRETHLLDQGGIKAEDFRANGGIIKEKGDEFTPGTQLVKFTFALLE